MAKNGQKVAKWQFLQLWPNACHLPGHVGYLWINTDEIDQIQKELSELEL